jgi:hypothetical protein
MKCTNEEERERQTEKEIQEVKRGQKNVRWRNEMHK